MVMSSDIRILLKGLETDWVRKSKIISGEAVGDFFGLRYQKMMQLKYHKFRPRMTLSWC